MINSVSGETMENLRKSVVITIVNNEKDYLRHVSKPTFISLKIIGKNYAAIHEIKPFLSLNKLIYVGFTAPFIKRFK